MNKKLAGVSPSDKADNEITMSMPKPWGQDVVAASGGGVEKVVGSNGAESHKSIPEEDNYCLRALQCACELREHKDSNLGTHIAVTAGR